MIDNRALVFAAAMASALLGCSAPPDAALRPQTAASAPTAGAVVHESGSFAGGGGFVLFEQSWHPAKGAPRAVLIAHHGLKDHSDRYAPFAERLVGDGLAVYAYDMRGHGRSPGPRATLDDFDDELDDLAIFLERVRAREPGKPVFLLGHSVGGAIVTLFTLERRPALAGLIVLAPAIRVDRMPFEAAATPVAAALLPNLPVVDTPDSDFSRSPAVVDEMGKSAFVYHEVGPARTAAALLEAIGRVWDRADTLDVPLLGLHGTADALTDPRGTAELVERARTKDKKLLLYRGLYHDLLHEPEREQVTTDIERWILERSPITAL